MAVVSGNDMRVTVLALLFVATTASAAFWSASPSETNKGNEMAAASGGDNQYRAVAQGPTTKAVTRNEIVTTGTISTTPAVCTCTTELHSLELRVRSNTERLEKLHKQMSGLLEEMITLENGMTVMGLEGKSGTSQNFNVAFSARVGYNRPFLSETEVIVFDEIVINNANAYDPSTGKFTSPLPGVYHFEATILSGFNTSIETMIVHNGDEVSRLYSGAFNNRGVGSNSVVLNMRQGDDVWVSVFFGNGDYVHGQWSTFTGHLVHGLA
ncbi:hypothetical protein C0Q70_19122 [Pomacea canaliculata]|uniref:C1q domain-containing protein n=2 Tax=Pomacea canaliculata TaxID=400727 RepID=A0A2T7NIF8_POMCA|nr:hypothetical protein C0Q70_19122 [Pomacea canaliculata]